MTSLIIGLGEIGLALHKILKDEYGDKIFGYDTAHPEPIPEHHVGILHICIPWSKDFINIVEGYIDVAQPIATIIHSSVPVGTTKKIKGKTFHSPVRGKHPNMEDGLKTYCKYISFDDMDLLDAQELAGYFTKAGILTKVVTDTKTTELGKLLALARYGVYIAFAKEQEDICEKFGVSYHKAVTDFENTRNDGVEDKLKQPLLFPFDKFIGGHCTVEDMEIVLDQYETPLMKVAYDIGRNTKVWENCNIYDTAKIGKGCSIGGGSEIGHNVVIGNNVRIGAMCFIPEGVVIEDDCFIAPKVTFSNDKYPPSKQECWGKILVKKGATIGMGSVILPDVTIGENVLIGAGSVVTKHVPKNERWFGNPARPHEVKDA